MTDSGKLNVLFSVVKSSDAKKVAAQKQSDAAEAAGAFVPAETEELILATADKSVLKLWKTGRCLHSFSVLLQRRVTHSN